MFADESESPSPHHPTMNVLLILQLLAFFNCASALSTITPLSTPKRVVVFGPTGRIGRLVVNDLLSRNNGTLSVRCIVRDINKAKKFLPMDSFDSSRLEIVQGNLESEKQLTEYCTDVDGAVWCATGFSDATSNVNKLLGLLKLKFSPASVIDIKALKRVGELLNDRQGLVPNGPTIVVCSSAGVTRPSWSQEKKLRLVGAADIPIVRLNPLNILDVKRAGEDALRQSMARSGKYVIARPCGLNDQTPPGRPLLSQGDVAVGRISRSDAAKLLVDCLYEASACGKTFEALALPGFPSPASLNDQFARLKKDIEPALDENGLFAVYSILQQIVPGTTMRPNELAMGQSYEQLDKGQAGRLGKRGSEEAPITRS